MKRWFVPLILLLIAVALVMVAFDFTGIGRWWEGL